MAAMVIVNTPGDWSNVYWPLLHAPWHGWTPTDLIFPFFVFIVGVSIVLSSRRTATVMVIVRRAAIIFALGLLLALYPRFDVATVRIMGVLQRLAICYLAAALIYRPLAKRVPRVRMVWTLTVATAVVALYWAIVMFVPVPGGSAGDLSPSGNLGAWIDRTVIGEAHLWRQSRTWDPEGLLSTFPAIATALTGVAAGIVLTTGPSTAWRAMVLGVAGLVLVILGNVWSWSFPINKNLWTSSYVVFTSGLASIVLAAVHLAIDNRPRPPRWTYPLVVLGMNALALFVVSGLLVKTLTLVRLTRADGQQTSLYGGIYRSVFAPLAPPKVASLLFALAALALLYSLLELMYRRRWFLKA